MKNDDAKVNQWIERLRALPEMAERCAPDAAEAVHRVIDLQIKRGTDPDGVPWPPRKEDGAKALQTAGKAVTVVPVGSRIYCRVTGYIGRHNLGRAKGGTMRRILPVSGIPRAYSAAIHHVLDQYWEREMKGKG